MTALTRTKHNNTHEETHMTTMTTNHIGSLVLDEDVEHVNASYETASWYDRLLLKAGEYPFRLTNINGTPWVPGSMQVGMVRPSAPYYAVADVNALVLVRYRENRLFSEVRTELTKPEHETTTHHVRLYAYEIGKRRSAGTIGRIVVNPEFRADTYSCIADLSLDHYLSLLSSGVRWLESNGHGDYRDQPHWHVWNLINAQALGGIEGYVKAVQEGYAR